MARVKATKVIARLAGLGLPPVQRVRHSFAIAETPLLGKQRVRVSVLPLLRDHVESVALDDREHDF
jgi:hypothetical protein